jgi:hypothetical protein
LKQVAAPRAHAFAMHVPTLVSNSTGRSSIAKADIAAVVMMVVATAAPARGEAASAAKQPD